jgi:integrative and conjugative element protein (TIGR02256 family)
LTADIETGGILIGNYTPSLDVAVIDEVTNAPIDSKSGTSWFLRGVQGLQSKLHLFWLSSNKHYYLGEWHYHPHGLPVPSRTDIDQMIRIATSKKYKCPEPVLLLAGGNTGSFQIKAYVITSGKGPVELTNNLNQHPPE